MVDRLRSTGHQVDTFVVLVGRWSSSSDNEAYRQRVRDEYSAVEVELFEERHRQDPSVAVLSSQSVALPAIRRRSAERVLLQWFTVRMLQPCRSIRGEVLKVFVANAHSDRHHVRGADAVCNAIS